MADMPVSIVTGASGGIGRWIARGLAQAGHRVVIVARSMPRAEAAASWIGAQLPGAACEIELADLSLLAEARNLAGRIAARHPAIAVLVNNAGMFSARRRETIEGHEQVLALNHLAPFVLTQALLPALHRGAAQGGARIVNIGSDTSDRASIRPDDLEGRRRWGMVQAYGQSKLALMMATFDLAARLGGTGVTANLVHPGAVATGLVRARGPIGLAWRAMAPFLLTEEQGAETPLHVALSPEFADVTGAYVKRRRVVSPNRLALDAALVARVMAATATLAAAPPKAAAGEAAR